MQRRGIPSHVDAVEEVRRLYAGRDVAFEKACNAGVHEGDAILGLGGFFEEVFLAFERDEDAQLWVEGAQ